MRSHCSLLIAEWSHFRRFQIPETWFTSSVWNRSVFVDISLPHFLASFVCVRFFPSVVSLPLWILRNAVFLFRITHSNVRIICELFVGIFVTKMAGWKSLWFMNVATEWRFLMSNLTVIAYDVHHHHIWYIYIIYVISNRKWMFIDLGLKWSTHSAHHQRQQPYFMDHLNI